MIIFRIQYKTKTKQLMNNFIIKKKKKNSNNIVKDNP